MPLQVSVAPGFTAEVESSQSVAFETNPDGAVQALVVLVASP